MSETMTLELFRKMVDRLPGAISVSRRDAATGKIDFLYINHNAAAVYGLTVAEMFADPSAWMQQLAPEDRAELLAQFATSAEALTPICFASWLTHANGGRRWIELRCTFEREADDAVVAYAQTVDLTERKRTEEALEKSEQERRRSDTLHRAVIETLPVGVCVLAKDGTYPILNVAQQKMAGTYDDGEKPLTVDVVTERYGLFETDGVTPLDMNKAPIVRVLAGDPDAPSNIEFVIRNPRLTGERRFFSEVRPIHDETGEIRYAVAVSVDITAQRALEKELMLRNEQLARSEEAKTVLIERLRLAIDELSNPILEVWDDVLAMPIIGLVDSRRTADMVRRLLAEVARTQATFVIVDLTGVEIVDTKTADHLIKLMRKVEIVGARCVLTGIRPAVSETLVDIGVDFSRLPTLRNLKHGLREALRHARREREGLRDVSFDDEQAARFAAADALRSQRGR